MIADVSRLVSQRVDGGAVVVSTLLLVAVVPLARRWRTRFGGSTLAGFLALGSLAPIVAVTLLRIDDGLHVGLLPSRLDWFVHGWQRLPTATFDDSEFLLNVVLFVPAGAAWLWCTRQSAWRVITFIVVTSFTIETLQALTGRGAADVHDWFANSLGGTLGVALAVAAGLIAGRRFHRRGEASPVWPRRRRIVAFAVLTVSILGGLIAVRAGAGVARRHVAMELERDYAGTTDADARAALHGGGGNEYLTFLRHSSRWADEFRSLPDGTPQARYQVPFFGVDGCVLLRWTSSGVSTRVSSGRTCTEFHG